MRLSALERLELAMNRAGCLSKIPKDLIKEASLANDVDIKIEMFRQWADETEEVRKKAQEELGEDFNPVWNWRAMPEEKAIAILKA